MVESHNIEYERKLIEALGYGLIGPNNSNRWTIVDDNDNLIGFIQYGIIYSENKEERLPAIWGYVTEIESTEISYKNTKKLAECYSEYYEFDIKRENGEVDHIGINMGRNPYLILQSNKYGHMKFEVTWRGLFLNFGSQTENLKIKELLEFYPCEKISNVYNYELKFCDKSLELELDSPSISDYRKQGVTIYGIKGIIDRNRKNGMVLKKFIEETICDRENPYTISSSQADFKLNEMVIENEMGIEAFKHFRFLINQILPFKEEVISMMINNEYTLKLCENLGLSIFISELENESNEVLIKKKQNKNDTN